MCNNEHSLINGNCVKLTDATYYFPVLILSILWLSVSIWATLNSEKTWFLTISLLGLTILEYIMCVIESLSYLYYGFSSNISLSLLASLGFFACTSAQMSQLLSN